MVKVRRRSQGEAKVGKGEGIWQVSMWEPAESSPIRRNRNTHTRHITYR